MRRTLSRPKYLNVPAAVPTSGSASTGSLGLPVSSPMVPRRNTDGVSSVPNDRPGLTNPSPVLSRRNTNDGIPNSGSIGSSGGLSHPSPLASRRSSDGVSSGLTNPSPVLSRRSIDGVHGGGGASSSSGFVAPSPVLSRRSIDGAGSSSTTSLAGGLGNPSPTASRRSLDGISSGSGLQNPSPSGSRRSLDGVGSGSGVSGGPTAASPLASRRSIDGMSLGGSVRHAGGDSGDDSSLEPVGGGVRIRRMASGYPKQLSPLGSPMARFNFRSKWLDLEIAPKDLELCNVWLDDIEGVMAHSVQDARCSYRFLDPKTTVAEGNVYQDMVGPWNFRDFLTGCDYPNSKNFDEWCEVMRGRQAAKLRAHPPY
eukprot:TRINITY_DN40076_c0_g1_i1.p1 TRINITY_DN40076_c0_g1~~TRINITY_DN40076_c0_g1_i1.p1  ORF type:complete len:368 (+),score=58.73 TRINITY_DN40076_c0_g1_i1:214-1317(+)